jgi:hypothetical protein
MFIYPPGMYRAWEAQDPDPSRPIAAPLERCAELLGVDLTTIQRAAEHVEPYLRADGAPGLKPHAASKSLSVENLERQLHPEAFTQRWSGGYITRRRTKDTSDLAA